MSCPMFHFTRNVLEPMIKYLKSKLQILLLFCLWPFLHKFAIEGIWKIFRRDERPLCKWPWFLSFFYCQHSSLLNLTIIKRILLISMKLFNFSLLLERGKSISIKAGPGKCVFRIHPFQKCVINNDPSYLYEKCSEKKVELCFIYIL